MLNEFLLNVTTRAVSARDARNCTSSLNYSQLCQMGVPHTKAKNACYWETLVISQVSVRNYFFYFTSILVSTLLLGRNYCCKCYSASGSNTFFISHSLLQNLKGTFSHCILQNPPFCIVYDVTKSQHSCYHFVTGTGIRAFDK